MSHPAVEKIGLLFENPAESENPEDPRDYQEKAHGFRCCCRRRRDRCDGRGDRREQDQRKNGKQQI